MSKLSFCNLSCASIVLKNYIHYLPNQNSLIFKKHWGRDTEYFCFLYHLLFFSPPLNYFSPIFSAVMELYLRLILAFCNSPFPAFFLLNSISILLVMISSHIIIFIFYYLNQIFKRLGSLFPNLLCNKIVCIIGSASLMTT